MTEPAALTPTSGADWRKPREEGYVITLPSGNAARLRPPALHVLMAKGKVPSPLVNLAAEVVWTGESSQVRRLLDDSTRHDNEVSAAELERIQKHVPEWLPLAHIVCEAAFMEPRIVEDPQADDEISLADLDEGDVFWTWRLATKGAAYLSGFRAQQTRDVADVHDLHGAGDSAVEDGED